MLGYCIDNFDLEEFVVVNNIMDELENNIFDVFIWESVWSLKYVCIEWDNLYF